MKRIVLTLLAVTWLGGCGTAIQEGAAVGFGAKGPYMPIQPAITPETTVPLREYTEFELGQFVDDINGKTPPDLMPEFRVRFQEMLAKNELAGLSGGKTLLVRGRIIHYEGSGTMALVLSGVEEVVVRTELVDKASGQVLFTANCIGRSTSRVNRGVPKKAEGLAKSVAGWIAQLHHSSK